MQHHSERANDYPAPVNEVTPAVCTMGKTISEKRVKELRKTFDDDPSAKLAQNAVSNNELLEVALDRDLVQEIDFSFSIKLDKWKVTHQKRSGRCWLFATLNLFRPSTMKMMNVKNFEFSQAHIHFWDLSLIHI